MESFVNYFNRGEVMTTKVSNLSTFQVPIHATLNGRPVRILALGEQEGKSPVYLAVKQDGKSEWESISEVQIIDPNALPVTTEALRHLSLTAVK
jgi:hypothetical protein